MTVLKSFKRVLTFNPAVSLYWVEEKTKIISTEMRKEWLLKCYPCGAKGHHKSK